MKQPRDYQNWAHNATWNYIHDEANFTGGVATGGLGPKYPLVVEATGLGKSLNVAMLIWHLLTQYPKVRIMQLCHVKELVEGNYKELVGMWPAAPAGVYAAGLKRRDTRSQVTFAMINSVAKRAASFGEVHFVLIDEAHRLSDNDASMYGRFLDDLRTRNPKLIVVGYTATDYRMKGGLLTEMELFDEVVFDIGGGESFLWAVEQGYLIVPVPTDPGFQLDDTGIGLSGGDFKQNEASNALHEQDIIERAVDYSINIAREEGRRCSVTFAQSIDDAELIADMFTYKGWPTEAVHSKRGDRDEVLKAHKKGELWGVTNKDILTTGWNNPLIDMFVGLRLTRSPGLWVQMVGRTTRPIWLPGYNIMTKDGRWDSIKASGKLNTRVLDFTGNTERLGPINYPRTPGRRGAGGGDAPVRTCTQCDPATYHHTSVKVCPHCGYEWPVETNLKTMASAAELVSSTNPLGIPIEKAPEKIFKVAGVHQMICAHHQGKSGKKDTMRIDYRCGVQRFSTWVCIEHEPRSFPRRKAEEWWLAHGGQRPVPTDVTGALTRVDELRPPKFLKVWSNTKYPEIVGYDFQGHMFEEQSLTDVMNGVSKELHEPEPDPLEDQLAEARRAQEYAASWSDGGYFDDEIPF